MTKGFEPRRDAFLLALGYFVLTAAWIHFSSEFASTLATNVSDLVTIERWKGLAFMGVSAIVLYFVSYSLFRRKGNYARTLVQTQQRLARAEREAVSGLLASAVAHDVNNLLTIQRLSLEKLKATPSLPAPARDSIDRLDRSTERLTDIVARLKNAGRSIFREAPCTFDAVLAVADTIELMRVHSASRDCTITLTAPSTRLELVGYPVLVHQLAMNLILNAAEATSGHGRIHVDVSQTANGIAIAVGDDGPGIPKSNRDSIFRAFFSTKPGGTGLGLSSVRSSVDIHGGTIEVGSSAELGGARFVVTLPHLDQGPAVECAPGKSSEYNEKVTDSHASVPS